MIPKSFSLKEFVNERFVKHIHKWYSLHIKNDQEKLLFCVLGIRRSGNHALINWLLGQMNGRVVFCNDMGPNGLPENSRFKEFKFSLKNKKYMIISHEDHHIHPIYGGYKKHLWGESKRYYKILLLRNPYELFASWYRWELPLGVRFRQNKDKRKKMIDLWCEHAREYLKWTSINDDSQIPILYDRLISDEQYQKHVSHKLNLSWNNSGLMRETTYGGGSSFSQNEKFNTDRNQLYKDKSEFQEVLNNKNIATLWNEIVNLAN